MTLTAKKWTDEEIKFLTYSYPNNYYTTDEIAEALNRSKKSIRQKAYALNLNRPVKNDNSPDGYKRCSQCDTILPLDHFNKSTKTKNGLRPECKICGKKYQQRRKLNCFGISELHENIAHENIAHENSARENVSEQPLKKCKGCKETKPLSEFQKNKEMKDGYLNYCKVCVSKRKRKWYINGGYKYD